MDIKTKRRLRRQKDHIKKVSFKTQNQKQFNSTQAIIPSISSETKPVSSFNSAAGGRRLHRLRNTLKSKGLLKPQLLSVALLKHR